MSLDAYLVKTGKKKFGEKVKDGIKTGIDAVKKNKGKVAAATAATGAAAGTVAAMEDDEPKKKKKRPYMED